MKNSSPVTCWVRRKGYPEFNSGVVHFGPECPPGWVGAAVPMHEAVGAEPYPGEHRPRLLAALERAARAESLLRAVVDACEAACEVAPGSYLAERIDEANRFLREP